MKKLYLLARNFAANRGGGLVRENQMAIFRENGIEVIAITPNFVSSELIVQDGSVRIPFKGNHYLQRAKEYLGVIEDYLDPWVEEAYKYLILKLDSKDVVFASASGELACLKLASLNKRLR